jgi:hypothetical protein
MTLPVLVESYLERVLPRDGGIPKRIRIEQVGEMWSRPRARPRRFTAVEELAVEEVAFSWRARFPVVPFVALHVVDGYANGEGRLEVRALGVLPLMRQRGGDFNEGEALRYLAELPWVPYAIRANRQLEWREVDERTVEVSGPVGGARVAARLAFDEAGDIVRAHTDARPRLEGKTSVPTPWGGVFGDYELLGGVRIPTRAEVRWELSEGPFTYWRARVTSLELLS